MAGTEAVLDLVIILGAGILVFDQKPDRCARGHAFEHAGQDFDRVRFLALGGVFALPRTAFVHVDLDIGLGERNAGRRTVDDAADSGAVAFAEGGKTKQVTESIGAHDAATLVEHDGEG